MFLPVLKRGDIVLVPFPFTSLKELKVRPAVIVSPDPQEIDILLAFISSVINKDSISSTDYLLSETHLDFLATGLKKNSIFKMRKLLSIERSHILRHLGHVSKNIQQEIDLRLKIAVGLS